MDLVFGVSPGEDIDNVKRAIAGGARGRRPDPEGSFAHRRRPGDRGGVLEFAVRPWVRTEDYWDVFFSANESMKKRFDAEGIRGPVPQREVRLHQA